MKTQTKPTLKAEDFLKTKKVELMSPKKKIFKTKDVGRNGHRIYERQACTLMKQADSKRKVFIIERIKLLEEIGKVIEKKVIGSIQYRFGYYVIGKIGNKDGKWTWGQFCPIIPEPDLWELIDLAVKDKTILKKRK
jgi:hypothetical protein